MKLFNIFIKRGRRPIRIAPAGARSATLTIGDYAMLTCVSGVPTLYVYTMLSEQDEARSCDVLVSRDARPAIVLHSVYGTWRSYSTAINHVAASVIELVLGGHAVVFKLLRKRQGLVLGTCVTRTSENGVPFWKIPARKFALISDEHLIAGLLSRFKIVVVQ